MAGTITARKLAHLASATSIAVASAESAPMGSTEFRVRGAQTRIALRARTVVRGILTL